MARTKLSATTKDVRQQSSYQRGGQVEEGRVAHGKNKALANNRRRAAWKEAKQVVEVRAGSQEKMSGDRGVP